MKTYSNLRGVLSPGRKNNHITSENFPQFLEKKTAILWKIRDSANPFGSAAAGGVEKIKRRFDAAFPG